MCSIPAQKEPVVAFDRISRGNADSHASRLICNVFLSVFVYGLVPGENSLKTILPSNIASLAI